MLQVRNNRAQVREKETKGFQGRANRNEKESLCKMQWDYLLERNHMVIV